MDKDQFKKELKIDFIELRKVINSWDLILHAPEDEFDKLNHRLLGCLYNGANLAEITNVLQRELKITYGLVYDNFVADDEAAEIMKWWKLQSYGRKRE